MSRTNPVTNSACYLCGAIADGSPDHVPPEVFFRGKTRSYKSPPIITVQSCKVHNDGASADDEELAWVISSGAMLESSIAFDIWQSLFDFVLDRRDQREVVDTKLDTMGARLLRDAKDYHRDRDVFGFACPIDPLSLPGFAERTERNLRERWARNKRGLQKIAAGIFYSVHKPHLGVSRVNKLQVVVPEFKQIEPELILRDRHLDEATHFAHFFGKKSNTPSWLPVISGDPRVFEAHIAMHRGSNNFAMRMLFFERVRVWVTSQK